MEFPNPSSFASKLFTAALEKTAAGDSKCYLGAAATSDATTSASDSFFRRKTGSKNQTSDFHNLLFRIRFFNLLHKGVLSGQHFRAYEKNRLGLQFKTVVGGCAGNLLADIQNDSDSNSNSNPNQMDSEILSNLLEILSPLQASIRREIKQTNAKSAAQRRAESGIGADDFDNQLQMAEKFNSQMKGTIETDIPLVIKDYKQFLNRISRKDMSLFEGTVTTEFSELDLNDNLNRKFNWPLLLTVALSVGPRLFAQIGAEMRDYKSPSAEKRTNKKKPKQENSTKNQNHMTRPETVNSDINSAEISSNSNQCNWTNYYNLKQHPFRNFINQATDLDFPNNGDKIGLGRLPWDDLLEKLFQCTSSASAIIPNSMNNQLMTSLSLSIYSQALRYELAILDYYAHEDGVISLHNAERRYFFKVIEEQNESQADHQIEINNTSQDESYPITLEEYFRHIDEDNGGGNDNMDSNNDLNQDESDDGDTESNPRVLIIGAIDSNGDCSIASDVQALSCFKLKSPVVTTAVTQKNMNTICTIVSDKHIRTQLRSNLLHVDNPNDANDVWGDDSDDDPDHLDPDSIEPIRVIKIGLLPTTKIIEIFGMALLEHESRLRQLMQEAEDMGTTAAQGGLGYERVCLVINPELPTKKMIRSCHGLSSLNSESNVNNVEANTTSTDVNTTESNTSLIDDNYADNIANTAIQSLCDYLITRATVLTPTYSDAARLLNRGIKEISGDPDSAASELFTKFLGLNSIVMRSNDSSSSTVKAMSSAKSDSSFTHSLYVFLPPSPKTANITVLKDRSSSDLSDVLCLDTLSVSCEAKLFPVLSLNGAKRGLSNGATIPPGSFILKIGYRMPLNLSDNDNRISGLISGGIAKLIYNGSVTFSCAHHLPKIVANAIKYSTTQSMSSSLDSALEFEENLR